MKKALNISTGAELKVLCCMMMSPAEVLSVDQMAGDADMIKYGYIAVWNDVLWSRLLRQSNCKVRYGGDQPSQSDDESDLNNWAQQ